MKPGARTLGSVCLFVLVAVYAFPPAQAQDGATGVTVTPLTVGIPSFHPRPTISRSTSIP